MANLAKVLKDIEKDWKNAEEQELGGFQKLPDGDYKVIMEAPRVELAKASDRLQIAWPFKVAEGKLKGKSIIKFDGLDNEVSMGYAKGLFKLLEIPIPTKAVDIPDALEAFYKDYEKNEKLIAITIKTKDEFQNIYVNGFVDADEEDGKKDKDDDKGKKDDKDDKKDDKKSSKFTKKDIRAIEKRKDLKEFIEKNKLKIDADDYEGLDELQDAIIEELGI
jgi:hypothetical protein